MKRLTLLFAILSIFLLAYGTANASEMREKELAAYITAVTDTAVKKSDGAYDFKTVSEAVTFAQEEHKSLFKKYFRRIQSDVKRKNRWSSLKSTVIRRTQPTLTQHLHNQITLLVGLVNKTKSELKEEMAQ